MVDFDFSQLEEIHLQGWHLKRRPPAIKYKFCQAG